VTPDEVSKKSLKVLDQKLRWLAGRAEFAVTVNSVLGGSIRNPEDALGIARRAGSRYLYVCEDGLVHWCSQQRGHPGIPLDRYTPEDLEREYNTVKQCAPCCTVSCVHQTAMLDGFRENPRETLIQLLSARREQDASFEPPMPVKILSWMFLTSSKRRTFEKIALRFLRVGQHQKVAEKAQ
jgi:hypothetical protein